MLPGVSRNSYAEKWTAERRRLKSVLTELTEQKQATVAELEEVQEDRRELAADRKRLSSRVRALERQLSEEKGAAAGLSTANSEYTMELESGLQRLWERHTRVKQQLATALSDQVAQPAGTTEEAMVSKAALLWGREMAATRRAGARSSIDALPLPPPPPPPPPEVLQQVGQQDQRPEDGGDGVGLGGYFPAPLPLDLVPSHHPSKLARGVSEDSYNRRRQSRRASRDDRCVDSYHREDDNHHHHNRSSHRHGDDDGVHRSSAHRRGSHSQHPRDDDRHHHSNHRHGDDEGFHRSSAHRRGSHSQHPRDADGQHHHRSSHHHQGEHDHHRSSQHRDTDGHHRSSHHHGEEEIAHHQGSHRHQKKPPPPAPPPPLPKAKPPPAQPPPPVSLPTKLRAQTIAKPLALDGDEDMDLLSRSACSHRPPHCTPDLRHWSTVPPPPPKKT